MNIPDELREDPRFCGWCRHFQRKGHENHVYYGACGNPESGLHSYRQTIVVAEEDTCAKWEGKP